MSNPARHPGPRGGLASFWRRAAGAFTFSDSVQAGNTILNIAERDARRCVLRSSPLMLQVEVTNRCNLDCVFCDRHRHFPAERELPTELIEPIAEISRRTRETVLFGYGEPLISPVFFKLLAAVRSGRVSFTTNGVLMTGKTADRILTESPRPIYSVSFSIDGAHPATYRSIRGPDLARVWGNLAGLVNHKRRSKTAWPQIWINFVAMRRNVGELADLVRDAAQKGVSRINVFHLVVWDPSYAEESLLYDPQLAEHAFEKAARTKPSGIHIDLPAVISDRSVRHNGSILPRCNFPWSYAYIRSDGAVHACCYSENLVMGNLREKSFDEIWNGDAYRKLRQTVNSTPPPDCLRCEMRFRYTSGSHDRDTYLKFRSVNQEAR